MAVLDVVAVDRISTSKQLLPNREQEFGDQNWHPPNIRGKQVWQPNSAMNLFVQRDSSKHLWEAIHGSLYSH
jgi:hypothetical protein